jgi:hypothetical protein
MGQLFPMYEKGSNGHQTAVEKASDDRYNSLTKDGNQKGALCVLLGENGVNMLTVYPM